MNANECKAEALKILRRNLGDDLERAELTFRNLTPAQLQEEYGQSGMTRQAILDQYRDHRARNLEVIQWLEGVSP